ncbi:MAG: UDP-glucose 4-epimerase GalE [Bacteroidales bacterium]|nr:UDP-glucose 4-epimerase GalE [Bacteroidales bacterium]
MNILVTGGAGFIGTHTLIELYAAGHTAVVVDNLSNSNPVALQRVEEIIGVSKIPFYQVDIRDREGLEKVFAEHKLDACIHFAGLKAVGESVEKPWEYYENNIGGTLVLVDVMRKHGCKNIIFSSSATVYGDPAEIPITENCPKGQCTNPYGWTKSMLEQVLMDIQKADPEWNVVLLRYFNPVGAHPSGRIGENPNGITNNLMPYITQVAVGKRKELGVFGNDYDTPDGTGVRDYIHVVDLAKAHVAALQCFRRETCDVRRETLDLRLKTEDVGSDAKVSSLKSQVYNIGTGHGYSVLDMVNAFIRVNGIDVPYSIKPRRAGDIATCYCNPSKAKNELGWEAKYGIDEMVRDSWNWQRKNPDGYPER